MSDAELLAAHGAGDWERLVTLYGQAADSVTGDAQAFFLTQAWVYALDAGDARASDIRDRLKALDRV